QPAVRAAAALAQRGRWPGRARPAARLLSGPGQPARHHRKRCGKAAGQLLDAHAGRRREARGPGAVRTGRRPQTGPGDHQAALSPAGQPAPPGPRRQHRAAAVDQPGDGNTATLLRLSYRERFALKPRLTRAATFSYTAAYGRS